MTQPNQMKKMYLDMLAQHTCEVTLQSGKSQVSLEVTRKSTPSAEPEPTNMLPMNSIRVIHWSSPGNPRWMVIDLNNLLGFKVLPNTAQPLKSGLNLTTPTPRAAKSQYAGVGKSAVPSHQDAVLEARRAGYIDSLRTGIYEIIFERGDGSERTLYGTLDPKIISALMGPQKATDDALKPIRDLHVINVVDTEISQWRSFKINAVKSFKPVVSQPIKPTKPYRETTLTSV